MNIHQKIFLGIIILIVFLGTFVYLWWYYEDIYKPNQYKSDCAIKDNIFVFHKDTPVPKEWYNLEDPYNLVAGVFFGSNCVIINKCIYQSSSDIDNPIIEVKAKDPNNFHDTAFGLDYDFVFMATKSMEEILKEKGMKNPFRA